MSAELNELPPFGLGAGAGGLAAGAAGLTGALGPPPVGTGGPLGPPPGLGGPPIIPPGPPGPFFSGARIGPLRSFVSAFFNFFPFWI